MPGQSVAQCVLAKARLLRRIVALGLPPNFLDMLVDQLGGKAAVAEMTGRRARIVRGPAGRGVFELRARPDTVEMDSLNVTEAGVCPWF